MAAFRVRLAQSSLHEMFLRIGVHGVLYLRAGYYIKGYKEDFTALCCVSSNDDCCSHHRITFSDSQGITYKA